MQRPVDAVPGVERADIHKKSRELVMRHFARSHREIPMLDSATTAHVAFDANVVRWVDEDPCAR